MKLENIKIENIKKGYLYRYISFIKSTQKVDFDVICECVEPSKVVKMNDIVVKDGIDNELLLNWILHRIESDVSMTEIGNKKDYPEYFL